VESESPSATQRRRLLDVNSVNLGRILPKGGGNSSFATRRAMPTTRTPEQGSSKKKKKALPAAKKTQAVAATAAAAAAALVEKGDQGGVVGDGGEVGQGELIPPDGGGDALGAEDDRQEVSSISGPGKGVPTPLGPLDDVGEDPGGGQSHQPQGVAPSLGSAKSPRKRASTGKEGATPAKKATGPNIQEQRQDDTVLGDKGDDDDELLSKDASSLDGSRSLSFGSDTEFLSDTYVIVDPEVKRNGTFIPGSLLRPGVIQEVS
jgi:hypothetical protein